MAIKLRALWSSLRRQCTRSGLLVGWSSGFGSTRGRPLHPFAPLQSADWDESIATKCLPRLDLMVLILHAEQLCKSIWIRTFANCHECKTFLLVVVHDSFVESDIFSQFSYFLSLFHRDSWLLQSYPSCLTTSSDNTAVLRGNVRCVYASTVLSDPSGCSSAGQRLSGEEKTYQSQ